MTKLIDKIYSVQFNLFQIVCAFGLGVVVTRVVMHFLYSAP